MHGVVGPPPPQLIQRLAEVLDNLAVDELELPGGRKDRDQPWNGVHEQARLALAGAQPVLGALPLIDVLQQHAPADDASPLVAERKAPVLEPAVDAVGPPKAL